MIVMDDLTNKQRKILEFVISFTQNHGYPPTFREIGEHFGFRWSASRAHLKAVERKGFIKLIPSRSRGIEILGGLLGGTELSGPKPSEGRMIPVVGKISAGQPLLAVEDIASHMYVDATLFPDKDTFALQISGDSMVDAGIYNGNYVVVRPQRHLENGDIGILLIGDEATVKRFFKGKGKVTLKPENSTMQQVIYEAVDVIIIGKVLGVIRKI
jgi:repressor LexA